MTAPRSHSLIIGAGLAGLAAADVLAEQVGASERQVTVVEPSGRVGGVGIKSTG